MSIGDLNRKSVRWMYKNITKPILFRHDPEDVHDHFIRLGEKLGKSKITRGITKGLFHFKDKKLSQEFWGLTFENPVGLSAGFDKNGHLVSILPSVGFGFTQVGTVTALPYKGNPKPRALRLPKDKSLIVNYGLKNEGIPKIIERVQKSLPAKFPVSWSVGKTNDESTSSDEGGLQDYLTGIDMIIQAKVADMLTINVSCPNTFGGEPFTTPEKLDLLLGKVREMDISIPVLVKLPINKPWEEFKELLEVCVRHSIDGVVIGNLNKNRRFVCENIDPGQKGSLSGRPTKELCNNLIKQTYKEYKDKLLIVGVGGIFSPEEAYEKIKLGASLLQLITGMIYEGPQLVGEINSGLTKLLEKDGFSHISEAIGIDTQ
jgi:dihydroorotate dehydrogenase